MWVLQFITLCLIICRISRLTASMTIDERIFGSATDPGTHYDSFHMTPDGSVMVLTEYDLMLTLEQFAGLHRKNTDSRGRRKAHADLSHRWTGCKVYYEIHESLNNEESKKVINQAIDEWEKYTCLNFIESKSAAKRVLFRHGKGCNSYVGMMDQSYQPQDINLGTGCLYKETVLHEIGHAIGFWHEHNRPDRDNYIKINWDSITVAKHNYEKQTTKTLNTFGIPYDYTSIMHYGGRSITTLDKDYQDKVGRSESLSFKDIKLANLMYRCARVMGCPKTDCPPDGFQFYKNYKNSGRCQCWCDTGNVDDPLILCSDPNRPVIPTPQPVPAADFPEPAQCEDMHPDCQILKSEGECEKEMMTMKAVCPKTCEFCNKGEGMCMDQEKSCKMVATADLCKGDLKDTMEELCPASCGVCSDQPDPCEIHREFMGSDVVAPGGNNAGIMTSLTSSSLLVVVTVTVVSCLTMRMTF